MVAKLKERVTLKCDCCDEQHGVGMAYREGDRLIITRQNHGQRHILVVSLDNQQDTVQNYRIIE